MGRRRVPHDRVVIARDPRAGKIRIGVKRRARAARSAAARCTTSPVARRPARRPARRRRLARGPDCRSAGRSGAASRRAAARAARCVHRHRISMRAVGRPHAPRGRNREAPHAVAPRDTRDPRGRQQPRAAPDRRDTQPGVEARAVEMPAVTVRIARGSRFRSGASLPHADAIAVAGTWRCLCASIRRPTDPVSVSSRARRRRQATRRSQARRDVRLVLDQRHRNAPGQREGSSAATGAGADRRRSRQASPTNCATGRFTSTRPSSAPAVS